MQTTPASTLRSLILDSMTRFADRTAIVSDDQEISYLEFLASATELATRFGPRSDERAPHFIAICAGDPPNQFIGHAAALIAGYGYLPIAASTPPSRAAEIIARSGAGVVVCDHSSRSDVQQMVTGGTTPIEVIEIPTIGSSPPTSASPPTPTNASPFAYLLFTSGSTGRPKGVPIRHESIVHYLNHVSMRYGLGPEDRFSQLFPTTFDLSIFDQFACWSVGGSVHVGESRSLESYVHRHRITVLFCVPSRVRLASQVGDLLPGSLPSVRLALFCGEALRNREADAMALAAPAATVENLYGPTEATLSCLMHRHTPTNGEDPAGIVPIGTPHADHEVAIRDPASGQWSNRGRGELLIAGPQVFDGYWQEPSKTAEAFATSSDGVRFYRTGDLVERIADTGDVHFLGRLDTQIKILGHRVELGEIDAALMTHTGADTVATVAVRDSDGEVELLVGFIRGADAPTDLRSRLGETLPRYMIPAHVEVLTEFPLNASGKIDRRALERHAAELV